MMFLIVLGLIVLAVAFFHYTQGFFSAAISAVLCIFSAVLAISYHEVIVEKYLGGAMANNAHGATVLVMFAVIYLIFRLIFDKLIPGNVTMPAMADKVGGGAMGLVAGLFTAGLCAFAAQSMAFGPSLMGYTRFASEPLRDATIPQGGNQRGISRNMYDALNTGEPLHLAEADKTKLMVPADDILMEVLYNLSENGALASRSIKEVHPDWLTELFGQRLGMQASAGRVAINKPDGTQTDVIAIADDSHKDAGLYLLDRQIPQKVHEFSTVARGTRDKMFPTKTKPGEIVVVARVYFGPKAKDNRDRMLRLSMGACRLVTKKRIPGSDEYEWVNYFPQGTIEEGSEFWYNRADDYLIISERAGGDAGGEGEATATDKGIDLVFTVEKDGFLATSVPEPAKAVLADPKALQVSPGTFIEVKRMGRVDLTGQALLPGSKLKKNPAIQVLRKTLVKTPPKAEVEQAALDEALQSPESMLDMLVGAWEHSSDNKKYIYEFMKNQAFRATTLNNDNQPMGPPETGRYSLVGGGERKVEIMISGMLDKKPLSARWTISFDGKDSINIAKQAGTEQLQNFTRRPAGESLPTPMPSENPGAAPATPENNAPPATPAAQAKPAAPAAPAAPAMKTSTSLVVADLIENRKFYTAIPMPAAGGEAQVTGGTVTFEDQTIKAIKIDGATETELKAGTGEPINRLAAGTGTKVVQVEAAPGADGGGWAWKDRVGQIAVVDLTGKKYYPNGVWLVTADEKLVARYNADAVVSLSDFTPAGTASKVYLVFAIPEEQQIKQVLIGDELLKTFANPLP